MPKQPHVLIGTTYWLIDTDAEVPFRRYSASLMQPRTDISGAPGALNLQRNIWPWTMTEFSGGEGREVFDSSDPLGPPTFWKTDGGVDTRIRGEFSLHPDEQLVTNDTGGSAPTTTTWTNTGLSTLAGSPTFSAGPAATHVRLAVNDSVQTPDRTPGAIPVRVWARVVNAKTKTSNKTVDAKLRIRNTTDGTNVDTVTKSLRENEPRTLQIEFTGTAGKTYRYYVENVDGGTGVTFDVKAVKEQTFAATITPNDFRDVSIGIGDKVWAAVWDGTNTDILRWNFSTDTWDLLTSNIEASQPRSLVGSDQYEYLLTASGNIWRIDSSGTAADYANPPTTSGVGEELGLAVADNKLWALYDQALFKLTLDSTAAGLPFDEGEADYAIVVSPAAMPKEASPDTTKRQHIAGMANGVRWFVNVRGSQTVIYEYDNSGTNPAAESRWMLPRGYVATAIHHYANITFIGASFTNSASDPATSRAGLFYIGSDDLLRFLGYLRFSESNSQPITYIDSYGHNVYILQGARRWRYDLGGGGLTLENVCSAEDETKPLAMASMDKKFWIATSGEGCFVADDTYPTTTMYLYSPVWDYDVPDLQKVLLSFDVVTAPLPANTQIDVEYRLDEATTWTSAGSITTDDVVKSRIAVSSSSSTVKFTTLQWRIGLTSTDGVDTPRVRSVTPRAYVLDYDAGFEFTILLDDDTSTDRMVTEQRRGRQKAQSLWTIINNKNLVAFEDHFSSTLPGDKDSYTVVLEDPVQHVNDKGQSALRLRAVVVA